MRETDLINRYQLEDKEVGLGLCEQAEAQWMAFLLLAKDRNEHPKKYTLALSDEVSVTCLLKGFVESSAQFVVGEHSYLIIESTAEEILGNIMVFDKNRVYRVREPVVVSSSIVSLERSIDKFHNLNAALVRNYLNDDSDLEKTLTPLELYKILFLEK